MYNHVLDLCDFAVHKAKASSKDQGKEGASMALLSLHSASHDLSQGWFFCAVRATALRLVLITNKSHMQLVIVLMPHRHSTISVFLIDEL